MRVSRFGSILKKELLKTGHTCVSIDLCPDTAEHPNLTCIQGDIRNRPLVEKTFGGNRFDAVFHFAAMLAHDRKRIDNLWTSNVDGTEIIADACIRHGVGKLVFTSTNCLWAKNFDEPVTEDEPPSPIGVPRRCGGTGPSVTCFRGTRVRC